MTTTLPLYTELGSDRQPLADLLPLPGPMAVYIQTTSACNFRCLQCPVSAPDYAEQYGKGRMSTGEFATVLAKLNGSGVLKVVRPYGLGEPLLDPTLHEKIALAAALGVRTELTTNGSLLDDRWAERLVRSGLQYLRVSLYDPPNEAVEVGVRTLHQVRERLGSATPLIHVQPLGAEFFRWQHAHATFGLYADSIMGTALHNWGTMAVEGAAPSHKAVCPMPFYTLQVQWNGDVMPCCVAPKSLVVGNLLRQALDAVWNGEPLRTLRQAHLDRNRASVAACAHCTFPSVTRDNLDSYNPA